MRHITIQSPRQAVSHLFNIAIILAVTALPTLSQAAPAGTVQTDFGGRESITATVLQPDGKLVAVGYFYGGGSNSFALARYNTDGKLDTTFGTAGKVLTTNFGASSGYAGQAEAKAVALQADGKIVVAGDAYTNDIALARYNPDGSLDTTFGTGGKVVTDWGALSELAFAVGVQSTGKIIVGGYTDTKGTFDFVMSRYNSDGSIDTSFGVNGIVYTDFAASDDRIEALKVIAGDKIIAVGRSDYNIAVAQYSAAGVLDAQFGTGGKVTTDLGGYYWEMARAVAIDANRKIVVAGHGGPNGDVAVLRYTTSGSLDGKFGSGGKVLTNLGSTNDQAASVGINSSTGKIVVAGYVGNGSGFEVLRYNTNGALDNTFGSGGRVSTRIGSNSYEQAVALVMQGNGQIIAGGNAGSSTTQDNFALARYNASNGSLDTSYGLKADLAVSISANLTTVKIGSNVTYTITVTNNGPDTVDGLPIRGTPTGATFVSASASSGNCDSYGTCILGSLLSGTSATVTTVASPMVLGTLTNTITLSSTVADTNPANNTASVDVLVDGAADLSVSSTVSSATAKWSDRLTYTVTVTNHGPDAAANAAVNVSFSQGEFISFTTSAGSCELSYYLYCNLGSIASGASAVVTLVLKVHQNGGYLVGATASSLNDPNQANNIASVSATANTAYDLAVSMTASPEPVQIGQNISYRILVQNLGPDRGPVELYATTGSAPDRNMVYVSASSAQGDCYLNYYDVGCDLGALASGASAVVTLVVTPLSSAFTLTASTKTGYLYPTPDPNPTNNVASVTSTVNGNADLVLSVTDSPDPVSVGSYFTYNITLRNNGPDAANQTLVTGTTARDAYVGFITPSQGSCGGEGSGGPNAAGYIYCNLGVLGSGSSVTIAVTMLYEGATGVISSSFSASSWITDANTANNSATVDTTVTGSADLAISMTASPNPVRAGRNLTYTLTVTNNGPNTALQTTLTDTLPSGLTLVSVTSPQTYCYTDGNAARCYPWTLASGASATVTIVATALSSGSVSHTASVSSVITDPNPANNSATATVTVR